MKKILKNRILILCLVYAAIILGFVIVALQDYSPTEREVMSYTAPEGGFDLFEVKSRSSVNQPISIKGFIARSGISLEADCSNVWIQGADTINFKQHYGGVYEFILKNYNSFSVINWELTIVFEKLTEIDSSWRCDVSSTIGDDSTVVIIKPVKDPGETEKNQTVIKPESKIQSDNDHISFGMVIHSSKEVPKLLSMSLIAKTTRSITDNPVFWLLVVLASITVAVTLLFIGFSIKERQFRRQREHDERIIIQSINTFVNFIDAKDPYTRGHSARVASYSAKLAKRMNLPEEAQKNLYYIALMHDVGKVSIPDSILQKPGKLNPEERKIIESHTSVGGQMLRDFTAIPGIVSGALYHHERFDGTGYPHGLQGSEIPLFARIICVADSFDAMSSRRCYRSKLSYEEIVRELNTNAGKQFDPEIVRIMTDILNDAAAKGHLADFNL